MASVDRGLYQTPEASGQSSMEDVDRWLIRAFQALMSNWDDASGNFWRDSLMGKGDSSEHDGSQDAPLGTGKGSTSNNRSFQAVVALTNFLDANPEIDGAAQCLAEARTVVGEMIQKYFSISLDRLRSHGENQQNKFSDSQLVISLSMALSPAVAQVCQLDLSADARLDLVAKLRTLVREIVDGWLHDGVKVHDSALPHHFLTLHAVRALQVAQRTLATVDSQHDLEDEIRDLLDSPSLQTSVRREIVQQLGLHMIPAPGFDSSALVSSCALLSRLRGDSDAAIIREAVKALVSDQTERGTWTSAGVLSFGRRRLVYIPSVELSLAMTNLAHMGLLSGGLQHFELALPALEGSFRLVRSSYGTDGTSRGWRNDRSLSGYEVESWTTAVVLQFLVAYRELLRDARQDAILEKYRAERQPQPFEQFWPDLDPLIPDVPRADRLLKKDDAAISTLPRFLSTTDPTEDQAVVNGIASDIIAPTLHSVHERPVDLASFLLYGPPGTRKTTLVSRMAGALAWPMITLSPPAFLRTGIEGFEAVADEIFEDLTHLRRVVVLFDECEEFFRYRPKDSASEIRTGGAFITAGMLPRLQRLRDGRWIVFVINSNSEAYELDGAVTRRGRLDKANRIGHPVLAAQQLYLDRWASRETGEKLSVAQRDLFLGVLTPVEAEAAANRNAFSLEIAKLQAEYGSSASAEFRRKMRTLDEQYGVFAKTVTFAMLDSLANRVLKGEIATAESLGKNLDEEFARFGPDKF